MASGNGLVVFLSIEDVHASSASPIGRSSLEEGANSTQVALVPEEVCLLGAFAPEFNGVR